MPKKGAVREDGLIYLKSRKTRSGQKEVWVDSDTYKRHLETQRLYRKKRYGAYLQSLGGRKRPKIGQLDPATGLYYITVTGVGAERWGTAEELEKYRRSNNERSKKCQRLRPKTLSKVCVGQPHPQEPGLFAVIVRGNYVKYGTAEELAEKRSKWREKNRLYRMTNRERLAKIHKERYDERKRQLDSDPSLRRRRGDIDPVLNLVFWVYSGTLRERWVTPERYKLLRGLKGCS